MGIDLSRSSEDPMLLKTHGKGANLMGKDSTNWGELSDAELANWAIAGKQEAFCTLFCRHKIAIYQCLMRVVRDKWAAEELWQEVYIKTWRNVGTIGGCSSPLHWLLESAKNRGIDHVRHLQVVKKRIIVFDPEIHDFEDSSSDPGEVVIEREIALEAWKMLTPRSRKLIELSVKGASVHEMIEVLAAEPEGYRYSPNSIVSFLSQARKELSQLFDTLMDDTDDTRKGNTFDGK